MNAGGAAVGGHARRGPPTPAPRPSPFTNAAAAGSNTRSTANTIDMTHASIPAGTPDGDLPDRSGSTAAASPMEWDFPVTPGSTTCGCTSPRPAPNQMVVGGAAVRRDDRGQLVLDNYDVFADAGAATRASSRRSPSTPTATSTSTSPRSCRTRWSRRSRSRREPAPATLGASVSSRQLRRGHGRHDAVADADGHADEPRRRRRPDIVIDATAITGADAAQFSDNFNDAGNDHARARASRRRSP